MAKTHWASDWKVGVRAWVEREGRSVLGEGRAELLAAVDTEHSITKAAKAAGMSYRRAWTMIQEVNEAAGETLVEAAVGGKQGGGARLTPHGRLAIDVYQKVRSSLIDAAANSLQQAIKSDDSASAYIHVAAAISLQEALGQILAEFVLHEPNVRARAIYGASNELADHLLAGAPGDVFISADAAELDRLAAAHLLSNGSRRIVARNGLAIVGSPGGRLVKKASELLAPRFERVALAEPACPLGQYSKTYLEKSGVYEKLLPKALFVDNSRAVLAAVVSGAAQAGVVFSSDAAAGGAWNVHLRVPASQVAVTYAAAIVRRAKKEKDAQKLLDFVTSDVAVKCLKRCGLSAG